MIESNQLDEKEKERKRRAEFVRRVLSIVAVHLCACETVLYISNPRNGC